MYVYVYRTKIQIGDVSFVFLLPRMDPDNAVAAATSRNEPTTACVCKPHQLQRPASRQDRESTHDTAGELTHEGLGMTGPDPNEVYDEDTKPPYSYATLIAQAINSTEDKRMTLSGIYLHIHERYPYFKMENTGWQVSLIKNVICVYILGTIHIEDIKNSRKKNIHVFYLNLEFNPS